MIELNYRKAGKAMRRRVTRAALRETAWDAAYWVLVALGWTTCILLGAALILALMYFSGSGVVRLADALASWGWIV